MANEKRLIDVSKENAKAVLGKYQYYQDEIWKFAAMTERFSTVDAVEVVRCRECKHHRDKNEQEQQYLVEDILICTSPDATDDCWNAVWPDHFCSYGERKEGDDVGKDQSDSGGV